MDVSVQVMRSGMSVNSSTICISYSLWVHLQTSSPQRRRKSYLGSNTFFVPCWNINVSWFLTWAREDPAGISTCARLESMTAFCVSLPSLTVAPWHRCWEALCADRARRLRKKDQVAHQSTPGLGAVESGLNSSLSDHKGIPFWHVNSEATERAHVDPEDICQFCFSQLWSTLDLALSSFQDVEGPRWNWMGQLRFGLSGSWKKENLTCKQYLPLCGHISAAPQQISWSLREKAEPSLTSHCLTMPQMWEFNKLFPNE